MADYITNVFYRNHVALLLFRSLLWNSWRNFTNEQNYWRELLFSWNQFHVNILVAQKTVFIDSENASFLNFLRVQFLHKVKKFNILGVISCFVQGNEKRRLWGAYKLYFFHWLKQNLSKFRSQYYTVSCGSFTFETRTRNKFQRNFEERVPRFYWRNLSLPRQGFFCEFYCEQPFLQSTIIIAFFKGNLTCNFLFFLSH